MKKYDVANGDICYFHVGYQGTATVTDERERIDTRRPNAVPTFLYNPGDNGKVEALPETDGIGLPVKENQPAYDLFVWLAGEKRAIVVQVTVSSQHSIIEKCLKQLKTAGAQHLELVVVTPVLTDGETMSVYTDIANQYMPEHSITVYVDT
ncbi:uncharacterized protein FOMMEDRAFT_160709 [Fomitiporia mediterranea MF3/22]|uniref:uncharacterized protein n=1 Tax=Fomitiporia mediterranea (strain MF3/22) TaxID=694068 RepID=UPI000440789D|nr:uncharacterized protein FOMMEDRAFT_160709 [Fomitiporia mediterranea MF3/22]EJC99143.1 hypothetical protein FOMMEDRAFT_160709 [Fomitiporia mediterranea MF3/22]